MAELNYPQYVFEDEVWIASTQAFVCRMVGYGADINKYPVRYQPIVKMAIVLLSWLNMKRIKLLNKTNYRARS